MSKPYLTTVDKTDELLAIINSFKKDDVLIGIPEGTSRQEVGEIGNATILMINEFGSPLNNIPPRQVLSTGIFLAEDVIGEEFKKMAIAALSKGLAALAIGYERIGMIASNSCKRVINEQIGLDPPSEATLDRREAKGFKGDKALVVTGQLRNAITYVVRGK